jgi:nucleotide-binding universal stress UspA family protein
VRVRGIAARRRASSVDAERSRLRGVLTLVGVLTVVLAELTLLMVVDYNKNVAAFEQVSLSGYVPAELKIAAYQFLAELMHVIPSEIRAHTRVEVGDPGETILRIAEEEESDMIVMGTHGFGTFRSLLMGSVSSFVTQHAGCPVLLCKGMPDDWDDDEHYII